MALINDNTPSGKCYEYSLFIYTLINNQKKKFDIGKEIKFGDKWDDLVVKVEENQQNRYIFLQIKLVETEENSIDSKVLLGKRKISLKECDFMLQKYFISYLRIKDQFYSRNDNSKIHRLIIFTNAQLNVKEVSSKVGSVQDSITNKYDIIPNTSKDLKKYNIHKVEPTFVQKMKENLKSDFTNLAEELSKYASNNNQNTMVLDNHYFAYYHMALIDEEVIKVEIKQQGNKKIKRGRFTQNFIDAQGLSDRANMLRNKLFEVIKKKELNNYSEQRLVANMLESYWPVSDDFDTKKTKDKIFLPNPDIMDNIDKDIKGFFNVLELRTNQLGVSDILSRINNVEIKKTFLEYYDTDPRLVEFLINDFIQSWKGEKSIEEKWLLNTEKVKFITELRIKISKPKAVHKTQEYVKFFEKLIDKYDLYYRDDCLFKENDLKNTFLAIKTDSIILSSAKMLASLKDIKIQNFIFMHLNNLQQQKEILKLLDAFQGDEFSLLVLSYNMELDDDTIKKLANQVLKITTTNTKKKVIFITSISDDPLIIMFKELNGYKEYFDEKIGLQYLKDVSKLLEKEITVQDQSIKVSEFLENNEEDYKIMNANIIHNLVNNKDISISCKPLGTADLEGAYFKFFNEVDVNILVDKLLSQESDDIYIIYGSHKVKCLLKYLSISKFKFERIKSQIEQMNSQGIMKSTKKRLQVCVYPLKEEDFKEICKSNPTRKIYLIYFENENSAPKFLLEQVYNPDFHVEEQRFNNNVIIKKEIKQQLADSQLSEIFIIGSRYKKEFIIWLDLTKYEEQEFEVNCENQQIQIVTFPEYLEHIFQQQIEQRKNKTIHLFEFKNDQLIWYKTYGLCNNLCKFRAKNDLKNEPKNYFFSEVDLVTEIQDKKFLIISGDPGIGKTSTLVKLQELKYEQENSICKSHWIIKINLKEHLNLIRNINENNSTLVTDFLSQADKDLSGNFCKALLSMALAKKNFVKPLFIAFDGFDEVLDESDRKKIILLLRRLKDESKENNAKFVITTRLHCEQLLENALSTFAVRINPMNDKTIRKFIKMYLKDGLSLLFSRDKLKKIFGDCSDKEVNSNTKIWDYTEIFLNKLSEIFQGDISKFIGIPLQLYLILGIKSADRSKSSVDGFVQWVDDKSNQIPNLDYLGKNLCEIYENFINSKYDVYLKKENIKQGIIQEEIKVKFDKYNKLLAKTLVFQTTHKGSLEKFKNILLSSGIVRLHGNNVDDVEFIHPTFAEYFASMVFINWIKKWKEESKNVLTNFKKQEYLLNEVLLKSRYQIIRAFFSVKLLNEKIEIVKLQEISIDKEVLLTAVKENNVGIAKLVFNNFKLKDVHNYDDFCKTILNEAAEFGNLEMVQYLLEKGTNFQSSVLHFAITSRNLKLVQFLIEYESNINAIRKSDLFETKTSGRHILLIKTSRKILKCLVQHGANVNAHLDNSGFTILHDAAETGKQELVEFLVEEGAAVNAETQDKKTVLHSAAKSHNLGVIKFLVRKGANINAVTKNNESVLHEAAKSSLSVIDFFTELFAEIIGNNKTNFTEVRKLEIIKFLVREGADVNAKTVSKISVLHIAAEIKNLEMVKFLVEKGADVNAITMNNKSVLQIAVDMSYLEMVRFLVKNGANVNNKSTDCKSALYIAAEIKNLEMVRFLVESGADINAQTTDNKTVLHIAAEIRNLEMVRFLVDNGADINAQTINYESVLHIAIKSRCLNMITFLFDNGSDVHFKTRDGESVLHKAVETRKLNIVKFFVVLGADIHSKTTDNESVLHRATDICNIKIIKFLVQQGSDVNAKTTHNESILHRAADTSNLKMVKFLVKEGADVNAKTINNESILHRAANTSNLKMVKFLVKAGADVNAKTINNESILHGAANTSNLKMVKFLVEKGADINAKTKDNKSVLHIAAEEGELEMIQFLVKNGVNINAKTRDNKSAMHIAAKLSYLEMVQFLVENGAEINARTSNNKSVLHTAAMVNDLETVKYLVEKGAELYFTDSFGTSVLHDAINNSSWKVIYYLIELGAHKVLKYKYDSKLLQIIVTKRDKKLLDLLILENEVPVFLESNECNIDENDDMVQFFSQINKMEQNRLALQSAICKSQTETVCALLEEIGNDISSESKGDALCYAALLDHSIIVLSMLEKTSTNIPSNYKSAALDYALEAGNTQSVFSILNNVGNDIAISDKCVALCSAIGSGHAQLVLVVLKQMGIFVPQEEKNHILLSTGNRKHAALACSFIWQITIGPKKNCLEILDIIE